MGQDHPYIAGLVVAVTAAASMMVASGRAEVPLLAGTTTRPAAAVLPRHGEPGWDSVFDDFRKSDLPQDIPLPDRTPYDTDPARRDEYLLGYKMGFVEGVQGMNVIRDWFRRPEVLLEGEHAGDAAGRALLHAREEADRNRRSGYVTTGKAIGESSPPADRTIRDDFRAFRERLQSAIKERFPRSLVVSGRENEWKVYVYPYADYSGSNSGAFVRRTCYKGSCVVVLSVAADAEEDAETKLLKGMYCLSFDLCDGRWVLDDKDLAFLHLQQQGRVQEMLGSSASYTGVNSELPAARMKAAAEQATRPGASDGHGAEAR